MGNVVNNNKLLNGCEFLLESGKWREKKNENARQT